MNEYDTIVVGVGTMGAATCYELACRGRRVLGLERFDVANDRASHHGLSRMFRLAYFEHPDYVTLLARALELWQKFEADSGEKLLHLTGGLYLGPPDSELVSGSIDAARQHNLEHEILDHGQLAQRFAMFRLPDDYVGLFENLAGLILPERAVSTYAKAAQQHGAEIHANEPVQGVQEQSGSVVVRTARGEYRAKTVVLSGGAWMPRLLDGMDIELTVTRQVLAWVTPKQPRLFQLGAFPCWAIDQNPGGQYAGLNYGFPMMPGDDALKIVQHFPGRITDPDDINPALLEGDEETFRPALEQFLPQADGPLAAHSVCLYTNTADSHFIVDRHPRMDNVIIACGFSGHGFKFASVMGQVLAELAIDGRSTLPIDFLSLSRFSRP